MYRDYTVEVAFHGWTEYLTAENKETKNNRQTNSKKTQSQLNSERTQSATVVKVAIKNQVHVWPKKPRHRKFYQKVTSANQNQIRNGLNVKQHGIPV